jgi:autotransporter-associated beta strand protein
LFQGQSLIALPTTTPVSIASGATFDVNGRTQQIASLTGPAGSSVTLGTGQLIVSSATNTIFSGTISGNGGALVKQGAGTLTLAGMNSYTGLTTVSGGTLAVNGSVAGAMNINSSGTLGGIGSVNGLVTVGSGGTLTPGNGGQPGSLTVGSLSLQNGSQTNIVLAGTTQGTGYSAVLSSGALSVGGTLSVTEGSGFSPSPSAITSFDILSGSSLSGTFSSINLPSLPAPMGWNLSQLYTAGIITATPFIPGDFSRDGHVDASDLLVMMQALADSSDYEANHGDLTDAQLDLIGDINGDGVFNNADVQALILFLQSGGGSTASVPEPSALVLLIMGATGCLLLQRGRAKRVSV